MNSIARSLALSLTLGGSVSLAADPKPAPTTPQDAKAIEAEVAAFTKAFNAGDADAVAALFTEGARIVGDEGTTRGREAIKARFVAYFEEHPKAKILVKSEEIVFVTPDVALEEGRAIVTPAEAGSTPEASRYSAVFVRQGDKWLQSSLRETLDSVADVPDRLKELNWLVGDWVTESRQAVVSTSCKWSDDGHFLLRDFTILVEGRPAVRGSQRIGWDPVTKQIRSWVFDTEGGFGEGYWSRSGDTWMIKASGVRKDGRTATATQVITRVNRDHLRWASFDRTSGDELAPDADEFTLVRKPPKPNEPK